MGWKGMAAGAYIGSLFGGPLGAILGAAAGHKIEKGLKAVRASPAGAGRGASAQRPRDGWAGGENAQLVFCASAAALFAKLAKADGVVTPDEIASVEKAFRRLKFSAAARRLAIETFRRAKDDGHSIYQYAADFARATDSLELRELVYELLWDLACADGTVSLEEERILRALPRYLGISAYWFQVNATGRAAFRESAREQTRRPPPRPPRDTLAAAYATLGADPSATDAELKRAYREKAKQYHPDRLKAQGMPDGMIAKANELMAAVNAAWAEIKTARDIK